MAEAGGGTLSVQLWRIALAPQRHLASRCQMALVLLGSFRGKYSSSREIIYHK